MHIKVSNKVGFTVHLQKQQRLCVEEIKTRHFLDLVQRPLEIRTGSTSLSWNMSSFLCILLAGGKVVIFQSHFLQTQQ